MLKSISMLFASFALIMKNSQKRVNLRITFENLKIWVMTLCFSLHLLVKRRIIHFGAVVFGLYNLSVVIYGFINSLFNMTHLEWAWEVDSKIACTRIGIIGLSFDLIKINYKVICRFITLITQKYSPPRNQPKIIHKTYAESGISSISAKYASDVCQYWTLLV